jgi:hypothetical protein
LAKRTKDDQESSELDQHKSQNTTWTSFGETPLIAFLTEKQKNMQGNQRVKTKKHNGDV